jgi:large subunit ribosomal protein L15
MPKRGFTNALFKVRHAIVNVSDLEKAFPDGGVVDLTAVKHKNLVKRKAGTLKILAKGDIKVAVQVTANHVSDSARVKIEAAGGSVELLS